MTVQELKGREEKYTQKQVLQQVNEMLIKNEQDPYTMHWLRKHW